MAQIRVERPISAAETTTTVSAAARPPRIRLESIDSLRALSAIAVVLIHSFEIFGLGLHDFVNQAGAVNGALPPPIVEQLYWWVFKLGGLAVPVFIVLSGYSLMIPVARTPESLSSPRQLGRFFYRRLRRIVPPYYAAMLLSLLLIALVPGMRTPAGVYWDRALHDLDAANVVAHLLLVHNLSDAWRDGINPPFWSMAVEWQIYFLFPLLVLLRRRLGMPVMLGVAAVYGLGLLYLPVTALPFSHTHFVLLFALGMAGAGINFSTSGLEARARARLPWGWLAILGFLTFGVVHVGARLGLPLPDGWLPEIIIGAAVAALVVHCARSQTDGHPSPAERALSHPALVAVGAFSYSLYLVHLPILALLALLARSVALPASAAYLLVILAGLPLSMLLSYAFHLAFERPFLSGRTSATPEPASR